MRTRTFILLMLIASALVACDSVAPAASPSGQTAEPPQEGSAVKLIYVYDAMCGWCYGFSPTMTKLHDSWSGDVEFEIVSGGLALGDRAVPISQARDYIRGALQRVEQVTGTPFGKGFHHMLDEGTYFYSSMPPARATAVMREMAPGHAVPFASDMQRALFFRGEPLDAAATYRTILTDARYADVDADAFITRWESDASLELARADFARARELGAKSYPTLILEDESGREVVGQADRSFEALDALLKSRVGE